jgi:hypothetical protein
MGPEEVLREMLMYCRFGWLPALPIISVIAPHISKRQAAGRSRSCTFFSSPKRPFRCWLRFFFEITSGVILVMIAFLILHEATAIWDVRYASATRVILPAEQHVHSVLEMLPLTRLLLVIALHWSAFTALFGFGTPAFSFTLKQHPLPVPYIVTMLVLTALFAILPYVEELIRGLRHRTVERE